MKMPNDAIHDELARHGVLPFARFMELALYCPGTGYYERRPDNVGKHGDFITSVSVGSLFGELLAFQFSQWLEELDKIQSSKLQIVEAGAHDGKLAADILNWLRQHRPKLFLQIEYCLIEPSANRQAWQRETLKNFPNVRWFTSLADPALEQINGVLFGNELLDAFPIHRHAWDAGGKRWFEWGVADDAGRFIWEKILCPTEQLPSLIRELPASLLEMLPDGYIIETSPAAENWWRAAAQKLARGKLLAIDYGFTEAEMISPARRNGTLRAYRRHQVSDDLLAQPGEQDLTAHVNFTVIQRAGETAGLKTESFSAQPQFLTRILEKAVKSDEKSLAALDARQIRQFQTLTHPEHLGRAFRVLVQGR